MKKINLFPVVALLFNSAFSGAFLFIAVVVVPFWSSLSPADLNTWFIAYFGRLPSIMVPLNLLTFTAIALSTYYTFRQKRPSKKIWLAVLLTIFLCSLTYPLILDDANKTIISSYANHALIQQSFEDWANWHWVRTILSFISLLLITYLNIIPKK
tara:strand:- start:3909 stop:4373 length:465 start_codon:yes stop_codon:yes gene_type:complete